MSWHGIEGHDAVVEQFRRSLARGRLASSFLFVGPPGIGKRTFALKLAQALLCQSRPEAALDPCETCASCQQVAAGTHPDLDTVAKPADKADIPLALLIGDLEHRRQQGLCHNIALKPLSGRRKVAIIDDADSLNDEGANCLLKTLEEPPPHSVLILVGTSPARQLPTIRSRCQVVHFRPLETDVVARLLTAQGLIADRATAERLAQQSDGSLQAAVELSSPELWEFRELLWRELSAAQLASVRLAPQVSQFVDAAGKEAPRRRARLRQVIGFAVAFYREMLRQGSGAAAGGSTAASGELGRLARLGLQHRPRDCEAVAAALDRSLEAAEQVDRNANQTTLIEAWLDALAAA